MKAAAAQPYFWNVRVYYEDTDAAGVVYYANYLRYLERARTEWLAAAGVTLSALEIEHNAVFVVHRLEIDFRRPARLGDSLTISLAPLERTRVRLVVAQDVLRNDELISSARVSLACLDRRTWRPVVIPGCIPGHARRIRRTGSTAPREKLR
ncbi:MAG: tol-pal system-associated acyl-CoA thioesterase [Pseudomonadota bacterium]|nr:tol-pal system-associated acyl-CoA thioesterase [Pseudomonadota bacterium]